VASAGLVAAAALGTGLIVSGAPQKVIGSVIKPPKLPPAPTPLLAPPPPPPPPQAPVMENTEAESQEEARQRELRKVALRKGRGSTRVSTKGSLLTPAETTGTISLLG